VPPEVSTLTKTASRGFPDASSSYPKDKFLHPSLGLGFEKFGDFSRTFPFGLKHFGWDYEELMMLGFLIL
jgi:hypothetical protein